MKRYLIIGLLALIVGILHTVFFLSTWGEGMERWSTKIWFNFRGPTAAPKDVAVISLDETSYSILNVPMSQAWPRKLHAELVKKLKEFEVKRVVFDVLFMDPSSDPEADRSLAEAIKDIPTVLPGEVIKKEMSGATGPYAIEQFSEPFEPFAQGAEEIALAKMPLDGDVIRGFVVPRSRITKDYPALFGAALGSELDKNNLPGPRDQIWFYGPPGTIDTYPFHQILNPKGALPKGALKDRVVFIGLSLSTEVGPAQKDSFLTPFSERGETFGVEILATAAANLFEKKWIKRSSAWLEAVVLFVLCLALSFSVLSLKPQWAALVVVGALLVWLIPTYVAFTSGICVPGAALFFLFLPMTLLGSTIGYYLITQRAQQQVERAFQFYLSPEMAKEMRNNPNALGLGGESVYATALFTDIQGFTSVSEGMLASQVSAMLNDYFTEVMNVVFENKGTLIKFIGDGIFVLFGAPIKVADHAYLACITALAIEKGVEKFNDSKRYPPLHTRIGINTGSMVVGNLGSARRFDYTAIGDTINLASRVEGINKFFGTRICTTEATNKEIGKGLHSFPLGTIQVVGKKENVGLYTLFEDPVPEKITEEWNGGLNDFRTRKWDEAKVHFEAVAKSEKRLAKTVELYLKLIAQNIQTPPDEEWQGEVVFSQK